ncbi:MAG: polymerase subunit beta [Streptosporangiaceae bacterium]|nr:polymerase subunit beta [Streptosporangiaceae bacterium]
MKIRVDRDVLAESLAWVARALPTRPVVPVLSGLRLDAGTGLTLSCFDYEVSATAQIEAEIGEPGTVIVPGRLLAEITRSLPALAVEIATDADAVNLTCGSAEFTLFALPAEEYPDLPAAPPLAGTVDGGILGAATSQVVAAASRDDTLPMLTGVCLDIDGATLTLAATDRYRLAVRDMPWEPVQPGLRAAALVPARTLADAARAMTPGVPVSVAFAPGAPGAKPSDEPRPAEGMISFGIGGRRLTTRLIGGEFIRYRSRFPTEFGCRADVAAGPFTEAVRRVSLVADRASPVRLTFGPGRVMIEAQTEGRARAVETVPADFQGEEPVIAFNPHYLLDGLTAAAVPGQSRPHAGDPGDSGAAGTGRRGDAGSADPATPEPGNPEPGNPGAGGAGPGSAAPGSTGPADPGLLRIEFTSPAKPALITRVSPQADSGGAPPEESGVADFRYLVVPLRAAGRS